MTQHSTAQHRSQQFAYTHLIVSSGAHTSTATAMISRRASMLAAGPKASHRRPSHEVGSPRSMSRITTCRQVAHGSSHTLKSRIQRLRSRGVTRRARLGVTVPKKANSPDTPNYRLLLRS